MIVGVDVGTTSALAALNLEGEVVQLASFRNTGVNDLVEHIRVLGLPAIVASDVAVPPKAVAKIATSFGAALFAPDESLLVEDKIKLTTAFDCGNLHERDALAASLAAYRKVKNLLAKADALGLPPAKKYAILKGERIKDRPGRQVQQEVEERPQPEERTPSPEEARLRSLEKQVSALRSELEEKRLETASITREQLIHQRTLEAQLSKDASVRRLKKALKNRGLRIHKLEEELAASSHFRFLWNKVVDGTVVPVGLFPQHHRGLTYIPNKIKDNERQFTGGITLAFTDNTSNRKLLDELNIPSSDEHAVKRHESCFFTDARTLEHARKKKAASIESLIDDYRRERSGELSQT